MYNTFRSNVSNAYTNFHSITITLSQYTGELNIVSNKVSIVIFLLCNFIMGTFYSQMSTFFAIEVILCMKYPISLKGTNKHI